MSFMSAANSPDERGMRLSASDITAYYRPSECELRVYLRERREPERGPGDFQRLLYALGDHHEQTHLATFRDILDLSKGTEDDRVRRTKREVIDGTAALYQPYLRATTRFDGEDVEIVGVPDFLLKVGDTSDYVIRDSKLAKRVTEQAHPEILRQLQLYGWLYEHSFGRRPRGLEVHNGPGNIVPIPYDRGNASLAVLRKIVALRRAGQEPYSPVGWTKCGDCGFRARCWEDAVGRGDVAVVVGVDQGLAIKLRGEGIDTMQDLLGSFDRDRLADTRYSLSSGRARVVGDANAAAILRMAHSQTFDEEIVLAAPDVPDCPNYVMFDIEGLPPLVDELDKVYLWGLQVFGEEPGEFMAATAAPGHDGDRDAWFAFLEIADAIFVGYGDIRFVHWHVYERTHLDMYVARFGDQNGTAARIREGLLDLHKVVTDAFALPVPSYSLKVIERYVGFARSQTEYGGDWAMAEYIKAVEMHDDRRRREVMDAILLYNQEDLEATWAVLRWTLDRSQRSRS